MARLDNGPIQVGIEWKETRKVFGKEATEHFEVMALNELDKIVLRCDGTKGTTAKENTYLHTPLRHSEVIRKLLCTGR